MEPNETFGAWLRRRRRLLDMTQSALADCAGCSPVTVRKMEADERRPSRQLAELPNSYFVSRIYLTCCPS